MLTAIKSVEYVLYPDQMLYAKLKFGRTTEEKTILLPIGKTTTSVEIPVKLKNLKAIRV
ncbi:MAG: hypothetical protein J6V44_12310 [Methanobrevibacter sp.]|nr:hypothetical protein [Methanobrevibacter sp.]